MFNIKLSLREILGYTNRNYDIGKIEESKILLKVSRLKNSFKYPQSFKTVRKIVISKDS